MGDSLPAGTRMVSFPVSGKRKVRPGVSTGEVGISDFTMKRIYTAMAKKAQDGDVAAAKFCESAWRDRKSRELMSNGGSKQGTISMEFAKED